jgi:hypothetical protein
MLASTVQFSSNDQPPATPTNLRRTPGPATRENKTHSLRHPTARPANTHQPAPRSTPKQY